MLEDMSCMKLQNGILIGHARYDNFPPTRITCHEVGFHQTGHNLQVCLDKAAIDGDRDSTGSFSQLNVGILIPGKVVLHANRVIDLVRTNDFLKFLPFVGSVQTRSNENQDIILRNAGGTKGVQGRRQDSRIGDRSGHITDQNADIFFTPTKLGQGITLYRCFDGFLYLGEWVRQGDHWMFANHSYASFMRQIDCDPVPSIEKVNFHRPVSSQVNAFWAFKGPASVPWGTVALIPPITSPGRPGAPGRIATALCQSPP